MSAQSQSRQALAFMLLVVVCMPRKHARSYFLCRCFVMSGDIVLQVAGEMASAGLQRMMDGYEREKECSDLDHPKGFICLSTTGFAGGAPKPEDSGMH